jgi:hypothetical protein
MASTFALNQRFESEVLVDSKPDDHNNLNKANHGQSFHLLVLILEYNVLLFLDFRSSFLDDA